MLASAPRLAAMGEAARGLAHPDAAERVADLVEERFESDAMRGVLSVSGVIGTWAGPRSAGTAYVMLHHHIGETTWGFPRGGMGGVTQAMARAATAFFMSTVPEFVTRRR